MSAADSGRLESRRKVHEKVPLALETDREAQQRIRDPGGASGACTHVERRHRRGMGNEALNTPKRLMKFHKLHYANRK